MNKNTKTTYSEACATVDTDFVFPALQKIGRNNPKQ